MQLVLSLASKSIHLTYSKALNILLEILLMLLLISLYLPHRPASLSNVLVLDPLFLSCPSGRYKQIRNERTDNTPDHTQKIKQKMRLTVTKACLSLRYFGLSLAKATAFKPSPGSSFTFSPPQALRSPIIPLTGK